MQKSEEIGIIFTNDIFNQNWDFITGTSTSTCFKGGLIKNSGAQN